MSRNKNVIKEQLCSINNINIENQPNINRKKRPLQPHYVNPDSSSCPKNLLQILITKVVNDFTVKNDIYLMPYELLVLLRFMIIKLTELSKKFV